MRYKIAKAMITEETIEDLANFVLRYFNCNREYQIDIFPKSTTFLDLKAYLERKFPNVDHTYDIVEKEHGFSEDSPRGRKYFATLSIFMQVMENLEKPIFIINVFSKFFSQLPHIEQVRCVIHEARHIVDYSNVTRPNMSLDFALLEEYLRRISKTKGLRNAPRPL